MDLTIEVMLPPRGATDFHTSAHPRWRVLAIVAVYPLKTVDVVGMPRTGYIHVTGVPMPPAWSGLSEDEVKLRINAKLAAVWEAENGSEIERRLWCGLASMLSTKLRNDLLTDRQITVTWTQAKGAIRNVRDNRALADADMVT